MADACPVFPAHRKDGPKLDDDLKYLAAIIVEMQQVTNDDEVAGAGNRQEFGGALDQAEDQRFDEQIKIHAIILMNAVILHSRFKQNRRAVLKHRP
jgi:hypothetical protein